MNPYRWKHDKLPHHYYSWKRMKDWGKMKAGLEIKQLIADNTGDDIVEYMNESVHHNIMLELAKSI
uniref:Uncharacterized protein n=1 Tax=Arion vulgaris TaxID=1028688 RepID=A0A0B7AMB4_9EUPU